MKINVYDLSLSDLQDFVVKNGEPKFRAKQIYEGIYKKNYSNFGQMTNLSKSLQIKFDELLYFGRPEVVRIRKSGDGHTVKLLLQYPDGIMIETVLMTYDKGDTRDRNTVCVSTQAGCGMGCKFCASAIGGLERNLTCGDIVSQVIMLNDYLLSKGKEKVTNVVYMGMGEPLANLDNVLKSIYILNDGLEIGMRRIVLSTSGIIPQINELAKLNLQIVLAISLHGATDEVRNKLMPINMKYPIADLMVAVDNYIAVTNRRVTIEYSIFKDVNDSIEDAQNLVALLKGKLVNVNIIPVNEVTETDFHKPSSKKVKEFYDYISDKGIESYIREERGVDIDAACGQLRMKEIAGKDK